uniref:Uncharacterized protein n=1 Tax=Chromera velia CCMP2878 TaxID=1169474 RepID=A0A0G4HZ08_9ALVE|eukprot:Cvel_33769.t1-p1 / transcript=Cvel_33769.t1 / gene=Cvel_33769 / organism=Chromera_velia_CCMP2878 / gene_product=hypothetical protein / transcript_product=hypothetical protein / location=Cvel_scaffold5587:3296-3598(+) / protein_length=101 / sequence_SO=supercontig / SO=protein_coding / is_pseudo=false
MTSTLVPETTMLEFSPHSALCMACFSSLTYCHTKEDEVRQYEDDVRKYLKSQGLTRVDIYYAPEKDTECFVAYAANAVVVAFRGTEANVTDWLDTDAEITS